MSTKSKELAKKNKSTKSKAFNTFRKGIISKTTTTRKKEEKNKQKHGEGKLDKNFFPDEWQHCKPLPEAENLDMRDQYNKKLPRILIQLHHGKDLSKPSVYVKIAIGFNEPFKSPLSKKNYEWNEEFLMSAIENVSGHSPFLCTVTALSSNTIGSDSPIGTFQVDLFRELGMRLSGDKRRFDFPLNTQGTITITFTAKTDLIFPNMSLASIDGLPSTICLPYNRYPMIELTIFQAIQLHIGKTLQSQVLVQLQTFDLNALPGARPEKTKTILKTKVVKGSSPYWAEKCKTPLHTKGDVIRILFSYLCSKGEKKEEEIVKVFELTELSKLATATETRRWLPLSDKFRGGLLGIEIRALSNMHAIEGLPDPPHVLSVDEWNERQKNGGRNSSPHTVKIETTTVPYDIFGQKQQEEEPQMGTHIWDLLCEFNDIDIMADDDTQDILYMESFDPITKNDLLESWKEADSKYKEQTLRFELEMSRINLDMEREKQTNEKKALEKEKDLLNKERDRFLEGLGPNYNKQINNILEDINIVAEAAQKPPRPSIIKPDNIKPDIIKPDNISISNNSNNSNINLSPISNISNNSNNGNNSNNNSTATSPKIDSHRKQTSTGGGRSPLNLSVMSSQQAIIALSPRGAMRLNQPLNFPDNEERNNLQERKGENKRALSTPPDNAIKRVPRITPTAQNTQKKLAISGGGFCTLCKGGFDKNQLLLLRGKPFCPRCKERLLEGAKQRGMNI